MGSRTTRASLGIEATVVCAGCGARTAVTRLAKEATCSSCDRRVPVDWADLLSVRYRDQTLSVLDLLPGASEGDVFLGGGSRSEVRVVVERPRCACGAAFDDARLEAISFKTTSLACAACGRDTPARLVRDEVVPNARWAIGERGERAPAPDGIVARCAACGAPAKAGASEPCAFCGATTLPAREAPRGAGPRIYVVIRLVGS